MLRNSVLLICLALFIAQGRCSSSCEEDSEVSESFRLSESSRSLLAFEDWYSDTVIDTLSPLVWTYAPTAEGGWKVQGVTTFDQGPDGNELLELFPGSADSYNNILSGSFFTYLDYFVNTGCIDLGVNGSDRSISAFIATKEDSLDPDYQNLTVRAVGNVPAALQSTVIPSDQPKLIRTDPGTSYTVFLTNSDATNDQHFHLQLVLHPPSSGACNGSVANAVSSLPSAVIPLENADALPAKYTYQLQQITGASCVKWTFAAAGLGEGNEAKINVTAFLMTLDQATQFIASNFSRLAIARLGTVSQCVVNSESPGLCEKTVNGLDPDQTYFTFARDYFPNAVNNTVDAHYSLQTVALSVQGDKCEAIEVSSGKVIGGSATGRRR